MDSESSLPAKRLRASLNGNLQLTECIREFKLPRQFPSMATKLTTETNREKIARQNYHSHVSTALGNVSYPEKIIRSEETSMPNFMRKIKLRAKDGRDLGEVNVHHLPQNIQGKTICLAKNGAKSQSEIVHVAEKNKRTTIGVLTPVSVVDADAPVVCSAESRSPSLVRVAKIDNNKFVQVRRDRDAKKAMIVDKRKMSTGTDSRDRKQVLVLQSGKSWRMVKIPSVTPRVVVKPAQSKNTVVVGKWPQLTIVGNVAANSQNQISTTLTNSHNSTEISSLSANRVSNSAQTSMVVRRWSQSRTPDSTTDRCKTISPVGGEAGDGSKPKIEVSRIIGTSGAKQISETQNRLSIENGRAASMGSDSSSQKSISLKKDVMVVLPGDVSVPLVEKSIDEPDVGKTSRSSDTISEASKHWKYLASTKRGETKSVDNPETEENTQLSILERALSSVEDEELRASALRVLAECGIGKERLVPIKPASELRSVKDSDTQTSVFGLWDPEEFIIVPKDRPVVQRKRPIVRQPMQNDVSIFGNTHSRDFTLDSFKIPNLSTSMDPVLNGWVGEWLKDSKAATQVQNILEKLNPNRVRPEVLAQLEEDFKTYKMYDQDGLLNIHRAVIADQPCTVLRQLKVLKALRESPDLPTAGGKTGLELAVSCEVSPKIIKFLLNHGAHPTSDEASHDSALILASKKSLPILTELIPFVSSRKSLDNYDSSGFAALHHCAQNGDEVGVKALIRASANIDLRDRRSGRTALFHAVENEHMDIAQLLLDNGAQPNITNYSGQSVTNLIDENKYYSFAETLNRLTK